MAMFSDAQQFSVGKVGVVSFNQRTDRIRLYHSTSL